MDDQPPARKIDDAPFCWQSKAALWRIREAFDESTFLDQAFAVYLTLCELASDEQSPTFTATRRKIAERAGVSVRRVSEILARFKSLALVDWRQNFLEGTKELAPSTYTLTRCTPSTTLCTPSTRLCRDEKMENCTVVEQSSNNPSEEKYKEREIPTQEEVIKAAAEIGMPETYAVDFFLHQEAFNQWKNQAGEPINWKAALKSWLRKGIKSGAIDRTRLNEMLKWDAAQRAKKETRARHTDQAPTPETISPAPAQPEAVKPMTDEQRQRFVTKLRQLQGKI